MSDVVSKYKWYLRHLGIEVAGVSGEEIRCVCWECGKSKLHLNPAKGRWNCFVCGEGGTTSQLLDYWSAVLEENLSEDDVDALANARGLPPEAFEGIGIGWTGKYYTHPVYNRNGKLTDLRTYMLGDHWKSGPGLRTGLWGAELLADKSQLETEVFICEGEWDTIAMSYLLDRSDHPGIPLGLSGAGTFKREWALWCRDRDVALMYDNDQPGQKGMLKAAKALGPHAKSVRFLRWENNDPEGMDLSDLIGGAK